MTLEQWTNVDTYMQQHVAPEANELDWVLQANAAGELPQIDVSPNQGKFLQLLIRITSAKRVLEIGTLGAYSTIWMARGLPEGGHITTLELEESHAVIAQANLDQAGVSHRVKLIQGPAVESLHKLIESETAPYDFVFVDADKPNNPNYFELALKLTRPGSTIVFDNVVRDGEVVDASSNDDSVQGTRQFFDLAAQTPNVTWAAQQTVSSKGYDGFAIGFVTA